MIMLKIFKENSIFKSRLNFDFILGNYILAEKRLASLQKHLTKDSNLLFEYHKTMNDNIIVDIIAKLPLNENVKPETIYYFSPRAEVVFGKEITKAGVVFDASWKQPGKASLRLIVAGPSLLPQLYEIILFFRCGKIKLVAVIKQAFL